MNEPKTSHPNAARLDAVAIGDPDALAEAHIATCDACASYVASIAKGAETFAREKAPNAADFVQAVRAREAAGKTTKKPVSQARVVWLAGAATVLALAAAVLLFVRVESTHPVDQPLAQNDPSVSTVHFKGGMQVAVIVDHGSVQSRTTGPLVLEPEDRVRVEMAVDRDTRVAAGVLADDGEWAELEAPTLLTAGTHYSDRSVTFHDDVPNGWLLAGDAAAVARARQTKDFHEIVAIRVGQKRP